MQKENIAKIEQETHEAPVCPLSFSMSLIGGKWKCIAIHHLGNGPLRFGELKRCMPNTTQRMLTLTLRELEADGIVQRKVFNVVPPHVEYSLTDLGKALAPVMEALSDWGEYYWNNHKYKT